MARAPPLPDLNQLSDAEMDALIVTIWTQLDVALAAKAELMAKVEAAWSKNSCSFLIVVFEQGAGPFPASDGHMTWILMRLLSTSLVPRDCGKCEVP